MKLKNLLLLLLILIKISSFTSRNSMKNTRLGMYNQCLTDKRMGTATERASLKQFTKNGIDLIIKYSSYH